MKLSHKTPINSADLAISNKNIGIADYIIENEMLIGANDHH